MMHHHQSLGKGQYLDVNVVWGHAPSSSRNRSSSVATSSRSAAALEEKLRQTEAQWRNRIEAEKAHREQVLQRAQLQEEVRRQQAERLARAEEEHVAAAAQRSAQMAMERSRSRQTREAQRHLRVRHVNELQASISESKQQTLEQKLRASYERRSQSVALRQMSLAQQRHEREVAISNNKRKVEHMQDLVNQLRVTEASMPRSSSRSTEVSASRHRHLSDQLRVAAERSAYMEEARVARSVIRLEEQDNRVHNAIARRQQEIETRRQKKLEREMEVRNRVRLTEQQREMNAMRYEAKYQEAVEIGSRVAAFNAICRSSGN